MFVLVGDVSKDRRAEDGKVLRSPQQEANDGCLHVIAPPRDLRVNIPMLSRGT